MSKIFTGGVRAVDNVDLHIEDGEFMVLVGPSGSGKSTLLRMIAGLEAITDGTISIGGVDATGLEPRDRDIAMVFQNYALYPQMTVRQNLAFGLKLRRTPSKLRHESVERVATVLGLEALLDRRPGALSGGQRQRVAMGRAMVRAPKAFLMDEPLSNLDAKLRVSMRVELARLHAALGVTTVLVTHDQVEAMTLGQRVAVLNNGVLQQCDTPQNLFHHPVNLFVAAFIGSPSMNLVHATIRDDALHFADWVVPLPQAVRLPAGSDRVVLGIRPTDFEHSDGAASELPRHTVTPIVVEDLGAERYVIFPIDAPRVDTSAIRAATEMSSPEDDMLLADDRSARFVARVDGRRRAAVGEPMELALDPRGLHFFDPETGTALPASPDRAITYVDR